MDRRKPKKIKKILSDNTSGSSEILFELHEHLKVQQKLLQALPKILELTKKQFKSFQTVQSYLNELEKNLNKNKNLDSFFKKYDELLLSVYDKIYNNCLKYLKGCNTILSISNSKTVYEILHRLKHDNPSLKVIVCESRPQNEGRLLAKQLSDKKINVEFITEAMLFASLKEIDCALVGADSILGNGSVVNKIGSGVVAALCKSYKKPFYVAADITKISNKNTFKQTKMPPEEIWRHNNKNITINNYYFEEIEKRFITKIFTD